MKNKTHLNMPGFKLPHMGGEKQVGPYKSALHFGHNRLNPFAPEEKVPSFQETFSSGGGLTDDQRAEANRLQDSIKNSYMNREFKRKGIDNTPNPTQVENMKLTAEKVFQPLREWVGGPIKVNSFFRSPELNEAIGGSKTSQHCKGQAIDIDDVYGYKTNAEMYHWIKENLNFDQMIWEFGTDMNPNWVHISYVSEEDNRNRCLKAYKDDMGRTKYKTI